MVYLRKVTHAITLQLNKDGNNNHNNYIIVIIIVAAFVLLSLI